MKNVKEDLKTVLQRSYIKIYINKCIEWIFGDIDYRWSMKMKKKKQTKPNKHKRLLMLNGIGSKIRCPCIRVVRIILTKIQISSLTNPCFH